jgi:hypothetical protein
MSMPAMRLKPRVLDMRLIPGITSVGTAAVDAVTGAAGTAIPAIRPAEGGRIARREHGPATSSHSPEK